MVEVKCKLCGAMVRARKLSGLDSAMQIHYNLNHAN